MPSAKTCLHCALLLVAASAPTGCDGIGDDLRPGPSCGEGTAAEDGSCLPSLVCGAGTRLDPASGDCIPGNDVCSPTSVLVDQHCEPVAPEEIEPDVVEAAEPNDVGGVAGAIQVPSIGAEPVVAFGCVVPGDLDGNGDDELDRDSWRLSATGPALLDLESQGAGGLAPAYIINGSDAALLRDGWQRLAMDVGDGHARWQLYLPTAGDYDVTITDARSVVAGLPAGGPHACYYAAIRQVALPDPVAVPRPVDVFPLEAGVRVYAVDGGGSMSEVIGETPRLSTRLGLTLLEGGVYVRSVVEEGDAATLPIGGAGELLVVADASIDFGYAPVEARVLEREVQP